MSEVISATAYPTQSEASVIKQDGVRQLADYLKMFDDFRNNMEENRRQMKIDIDYYHGKQLTSGEKLVLSKRGQPDVVINRTRTAVNGILGVIINSHADPRCFPRTPSDEDSADVGTDVLRYIKQKQRWNRTKAECFSEMLIPGVGACIMEVDDDKEVKPCQIRQEEFFWDPRSKRRDFKDAMYLGIAKWVYAADVERKYKTKVALGFSDLEGMGGAVDETFQDRPMNAAQWIDTRARRLFLVELYHLYEGTWYKCVYYAGGILEEGESPYLDDKRRPCCPIEGMTCYVDSDNQRYGVVRDMRDIQDEINKRRSKLLHLLNSHQIQARDPSAIEVEPDVARAEAARPDGIIPYGWEVVRTTDMSAGQMQLLAEAKNEMERMGPNPAVLGRQGADTSGRALLARQQAGLVELALVIDQLDDWEERCYHQCWWRAKQYWRDEMWIRVTDDPDAPKFVQLNKARGPVIDRDAETGEPIRSDPQYYPETDEAGEAHPQAGQSVFGYDADIGEMDLDIIVDTQPETANIMQEMIQDLIKLVAASPTYAEQVPFEMFIELSPLPRKRMILQKLKEHRDQQQQSQAQQQQIQMIGQIKELTAKVEEMRAKSYLAIATGDAAMIKAGVSQQEAHVAAAEAATYAADTLHGAITDHVAQEQNQQQLDQEPVEPAASGSSDA